MIKDYSFFYKNSIRFIVDMKANKIINFYDRVGINKIVFFFFVKNLEDVDDVQTYNYLYLFRFFFGNLGL
jgi:hypothetical protein